MTFTVEVLRMVSTEVDVKADSPAQAAERVDRCDFPVPPVADGVVLKGWEYVIRDQAGAELLRVDP